MLRAGGQKVFDLLKRLGGRLTGFTLTKQPNVRPRNEDDEMKVTKENIKTRNETAMSKWWWP